MLLNKQDFAKKRTITQYFKITETIGWWLNLYFFFPPNREFSPFPKGSWIFREISAFPPNAGWPQWGQLNFPTSGLKLYFLWQWGQILQSGNRDIFIPPLMKSNFLMRTKAIPDRALASLQYSLSIPSEGFPGLAALPSFPDLRATSKFPFRKPLLW